MGSLTVTGNYTQTTDGELSLQYWGVATLHVNVNASLSGALLMGVNYKHPPGVGREVHRSDGRLAQRIVYEPRTGVHGDNQRKRRHGDIAISGGVRNRVLLRNIELTLLRVKENVSHFCLLFVCQFQRMHREN